MKPLISPVPFVRRNSEPSTDVDKNQSNDGEKEAKFYLGDAVPVQFPALPALPVRPALPATSRKILKNERTNKLAKQKDFYESCTPRHVPPGSNLPAGLEPGSSAANNSHIKLEHVEAHDHLNFEALENLASGKPKKPEHSKNLKWLGHLIPKRSRAKSDQVKIRKADQKAFKKAYRIAAELFSTPLPHEEEINLLTQCSKFSTAEDADDSYVSTTAQRLVWNSYVTAAIKERCLPDEIEVVPGELVGYLDEMRNGYMNSSKATPTITAWDKNNINQAIEILTRWWRLDHQIHDYLPESFESTKADAISTEIPSAFKRNCAKEIDKIKRDQSSVGISTKTVDQFQKIFAAELLPLSNELVNLVEGHLQKLNIRSFEFIELNHMSPSSEKKDEWNDFLEGLLSDISKWTTTTGIPRMAGEALNELFHQIDSAELTDELKDSAKYDAFYQLFMLPMINAVSQHLEPLHVEKGSARIRAAFEHITKREIGRREGAGLLTVEAQTYIERNGIGRSLRKMIESLDKPDINQYGS